uniref:THAP-type domain-containing protein n=1 Tax=Salmo trutta TaxID=8032 RepID=A0A673WD38_SALTR
MPVWCSIPGCANYKQVQAAGVTFHWLPARNIPLRRKWLAAVLNLSRRTLKCEAIPSIFTFTSKTKPSDQPTSAQQKISQAAVT